MSTSDAFLSLQETSLYRERILNAQRTSLFRAAMASAFLLNNIFLMIQGYQQGWQTAHTVMSLYVMIGWAIWIFARRWTKVAIVSSLAIPFLDMPVVFSLVQLGAQSVVADVPWTPYSLGQTQTAVFSMFIVLSMFSLHARYIWLSAVVGMALSVAYTLLNDLPAYTSGFSLILLGSVAASCVYARHRIIFLIQETTDQQVRRDRMSRFFSPGVAQAVEDLEDAAEGMTREVTVLVSDLRGFTALSSRLDSEQVVDLLNKYLSAMVEQIFSYGGTLDKFMGDGILAYFGAPLEQADHAKEAARCACAMQQALVELNEVFEKEFETTLKMGIGLHTGNVIVGAIGSSSRKEFTIIGDTVNLASRIEGLTKEHDVGILLSRHTQEKLDGAVSTEALGSTPVRGLVEPIHIYRIDCR